MNTGFHIFIKKNNKGIKTILKYPKKLHGLYYTQTYQILKDTKEEEYKNALTGSKKIQFLNNHIIKLIGFRKFNGEEYPFIKGNNLKSIVLDIKNKNKKISASLKIELNLAIHELITALDAYSKKFNKCYASGDWEIHNLILDRDKKRLVNVDLEGFYLYRDKNFPQNNIKNIKNNLKEILDLINVK